jgi:hypothetical protein
MLPDLIAQQTKDHAIRPFAFLRADMLILLVDERQQHKQLCSDYTANHVAGKKVVQLASDDVSLETSPGQSPASDRSTTRLLQCCRPMALVRALPNPNDGFSAKNLVPLTAASLQSGGGHRRRRFERQYGQKWPEEIAPIRVAPSALGPNTPHRELFLSRYHCLYVDGVLIPVVDLLNNSTISRCSAEELQEIQYFHFKLERHSVIYAEGAACETLRAVTAVNSDNVEFEEYRRLYGESSLPNEPARAHAGVQRGPVEAPRPHSKCRLACDRCSQQA